MKLEAQKLGKSKVKLTITIPAEKVDEAFNQAVAAAAKSAKVKGFRKGKAPLKEVEKGLDQGELNGRVINLLIPNAYTAAIRKKNLKPVTNPRIEIKKFARGNEFIFEVEIAEAPEVELGDWQKTLESLVRKSQIKTAATLAEAKDKAQNEEKVEKPAADEILEAVTSTAKVEIPAMLIEDEVGKMLTQLNDRLDALGLSPEEYLKSRGQTAESLRQEYTEQAQGILKTEFVLDKLADELQIEVKDEEIDKAIEATGDEKIKKSLNNPPNRAYIKTVIRKSKTVEKLIEITGTLTGKDRKTKS